MALFNYATKEITIKIVYYGPGLSGKTTNLQYLHSVLNPDTRGKLLSLATEADRTLFFDFLPVELGKINDFSIRFQLYTVPGQVRYNATRKLVLKGADAVVFVADSQREMKEQNIESLKNMRENLLANNINPEEIPVIMQYNKRDLQNILSVDDLNNDLNKDGKYQYVESIAVDGTGVNETFHRITKLVIKGISEKHKINVEVLEEFKESEKKDVPAQAIGVHESIKKSEPISEQPVFESSRYDFQETIQALYDVPEMQIESNESVIEKEDPEPPKEVVEKVREVPLIPTEKLETLVNNISRMSETLSELRKVASDIHSVMQDIKKDQRETNNLLRNVNHNFDNIRVKKSWFRFS